MSNSYNTAPTSYILLLTRHQCFANFIGLNHIQHPDLKMRDKLVIFEVKDECLLKI
jgi:hypothetical protein